MNAAEKARELANTYEERKEAERQASKSAEQARLDAASLAGQKAAQRGLPQLLQRISVVADNGDFVLRTAVSTITEYDHEYYKRFSPALANEMKLLLEAEGFRVAIEKESRYNYEGFNLYIQWDSL